MSSCRFLVVNGVISHSPDVPPVSAFLETHPGAYTTSRTHNNGSCLLFWERHLCRLADSARILSECKPELLFGSGKTGVPSSSFSHTSWKSVIQPLVDDSLRKTLPIALKERNDGQELAITALVSGNLHKPNVEIAQEERIFRALDVYIHIGVYNPLVFSVRGNGAHLAVAGYGRDVARAKFSDWVRIRKNMEKLRPPSVTELLLSNDGNHILEGSVTNFFVVCRKDQNEAIGECYNHRRCSYEVQTAPLSDGILPGVIRQLVIEVCSSRGIPLREVAPSWSERGFWTAAFITNSLRVLQHVEKIQVPNSWKLLEQKTWEGVKWEAKQFEEGPGIITSEIQKGIIERAGLEGYPICNLIAGQGRT